jgi:hypothetical protein
MPTGAEAPKAGLGTGIVEALARNLQCEIQIGDAKPGMSITIQHRAAAWQGADLVPAA